MLFWSLAAVLTAGAVSAVLYPLSRSSTGQGARRLFVVCAIAIPVTAAAFYFLSGGTRLEGRPYGARESERVASGFPSDAEVKLIDQLAASMSRKPDDPRGWMLLANGYFREARYGQAAAAYRSAIAHGANGASAFSSLGEALVLQSGGQVSQEAHAAFERALAADANDAKARYFLAVELLQNGNAEAAVASWRAMLQSAPADAPWKELVKGAIGAATGAEAQRFTAGKAVSGTRSK